MVICHVCGRELRAAQLRCKACSELILLAQLDAARAEINYLRLRCEEEGVAVKPRAHFLSAWSPVPARPPLGQSAGGTSDV